MSTEENPYATPSTGQLGRSIGLFAVTALPGFIGLMAIVGNVALLVPRLFETEPPPWSDVPWEFQFWEVALRVVAMLAGAVLVGEAVMIVLRRWKTSLLLVLAGFAIALANPPINTFLRHHLAGDGYMIQPPARPLRR